MVLESIPVLSLSFLSTISGIIFIVTGYYLKRKDHQHSKHVLLTGEFLILSAVILFSFFLLSFR